MSKTFIITTSGHPFLRILSILSICTFLAAPVFSQPTLLYVKVSASGVNNGTSWTDAYTKLQDAITFANANSSVTQIWVAAGTYYPDEGAGPINNNRSASFSLKNNLAIYGGFAGTETLLSERNWTTKSTILSRETLHLTSYEHA